MTAGRIAGRRSVGPRWRRAVLDRSTCGSPTPPIRLAQETRGRYDPREVSQRCPTVRSPRSLPHRLRPPAETVWTLQRPRASARARRPYLTDFPRRLTARLASGEGSARFTDMGATQLFIFDNIAPRPEGLFAPPSTPPRPFEDFRRLSSPRPRIRRSTHHDPRRSTFPCPLLPSPLPPRDTPNTSTVTARRGDLLPKRLPPAAWASHMQARRYRRRRRASVMACGWLSRGPLGELGIARACPKPWRRPRAQSCALADHLALALGEAGRKMQHDGSTSAPSSASDERQTRLRPSSLK